MERAGGVVTVTMNRPARKNAADGTMWRELLDTFDEVATDRHDRVMVLTGAEDASCSGADLGDPRTWPAGRAIPSSSRCVPSGMWRFGCTAFPNPPSPRWGDRRRCRNEHGAGL